MFENIIKFRANKEYIKHYTECLPIPSKINIPEWFKKLEHNNANRTVKGCMPFLDSLTAGYILKMPVDYFLVHNIKDEGEFKILNPWIIQTPPGYSCLFLPPMNNTDDRFSIIPAIVDTDTFNEEINFPFIVNGDKYSTLETTIEIGTPYVQVIPFKRESWKMKIEPLGSEEIQQNMFSKAKRVIHNYKNLMWHKKSWK